MNGGFLAGLPRKGERGTFDRVFSLIVLVAWLGFGGVGCIGGIATGREQVAGASAVIWLSLHMGAVFTSVFLQTRAVRFLDEAQAFANRGDFANAHAMASRALRTGLGRNKRWLEAWLVVAQAAEEAGAFGEAADALDRGLHRVQQVDRGFLVHAHMLRAFLCAVQGDVASAERDLGTFGTVDLQNPLLYAEYMRAKTMILYRQERYKEVVDVAHEVTSRAAIRNQRDAVLYASLRHSSMLRLEAQAGHHPMRVAYEPEAEAWLDAALPELAKKKNAMR